MPLTSAKANTVNQSIQKVSKMTEQEERAPTVDEIFAELQNPEGKYYNTFPIEELSSPGFGCFFAWELFQIFRDDVEEATNMVQHPNAEEIWYSIAETYGNRPSLDYLNAYLSVLAEYQLR